MRRVSFSDGGLRDRDIILRDEKVLVFCFLGCVVTFPAREANRTGGERRVRILAIECVSFLTLPAVLAFFHDQTHTLTQTRYLRRHAERPKGDREQFASLDFWIAD